MRKASHVLGLVGGCLALVCAFLYVLGGIFLLAGGGNFINEILRMAGGFGRVPRFPFDWLRGSLVGFGAIIIIFLGIMHAASGILGVIGARSIEKNNIQAGVLMLVGAGLSLLSGIGFIPMVLLLLGGIFALVKEKTPLSPPPIQ